MLLKIDLIVQIGRFFKLAHKAPQFGPLTLIYGRNGYGKSTLCAILRSAAEQDANLIAARRRLGATVDSSVQTQWDADGAITFSAGGWNACPANVYIFDAEYVRQNVYVGDTVTRENKRNLIPVVLGEQGVKLAENVSSLDALQKESAAKQATAERVIRASAPAVDNVAAFVHAEVPQDIDEQIVAAERGIELARHASLIKLKTALKIVALPSLATLEELAKRTLETVTISAARLVQDHIEKHGMQINGDRWLKYGLEHMRGNSCPFCTQDTSKIDTVAAFRTYFSAEYAALVASIESARNQLILIFGPEGRDFDALLTANAEDVKFWRSVADLPSEPDLSAVDAASVKRALKQLIDFLAAKLANPLVEHDIGEQRSEIVAALSVWDSYLDDLRECSDSIEKARAEAPTADIARANELLGKRRALKSKLSEPIAGEVKIWQDCAKRRQEIDVEKPTAQNALRSYMASTIASRQKQINELLELFGANFKIVQTKASFVGREASTEFSIEIGGHTVKAGDYSEDEPSFHTVLSGGDKLTLALALFITQVRADPELSKARILFDDPFSSQDMQRQWETTSQIRALAKVARQVIVLSHDPRFLALIEKNSQSGAATFQLMCDDAGNGSIRQWSAEEELKEIYVRQAERIREYASSGILLPGTTEESLVKDLRPFVEGYIRARFPARFDTLVMLDEMTNQIESAGPDDPLYKDVSSLRAINEFARDSMHAGAQLPDPVQLRAQCKRVVSIMGAY